MTNDFQITFQRTDGISGKYFLAVLEEYSHVVDQVCVECEVNANRMRLAVQIFLIAVLGGIAFAILNIHNSVGDRLALDEKRIMFFILLIIMCFFNIIVIMKDYREFRRSQDRLDLALQRFRGVFSRSSQALEQGKLEEEMILTYNLRKLRAELVFARAMSIVTKKDLLSISGLWI